MAWEVEEGDVGEEGSGGGEERVSEEKEKHVVDETAGTHLDAETYV